VPRQTEIAALDLQARLGSETGRSLGVENRTAGFSRGLILTAVLVFFGYYLGARIGFALTFQPHPVSVMWPPNSILLAALLLNPTRRWWVLFAAAFPAHLIAELQQAVPIGMTLSWFLSNSSEALIGPDAPATCSGLRRGSTTCGAWACSFCAPA
jgi:hypothetical protein